MNLRTRLLTGVAAAIGLLALVRCTEPTNPSAPTPHLSADETGATGAQDQQQQQQQQQQQPTRIAACGTVISTPGQYVLANDLSNCLGKAISVVVSDVDLDLDGHTIGGFVGFPLPEGFGIAVGAGVSRGVSHVRIHGPGTIHDFMDGVLFEQVSHSELLGVTVSVNYRGLVLNQGFGAGETGRSTDNRIQDNVFSNNVTSGLIIDGGDANRFRGNVSSGNGGHGFWLFRAGGNDLRGNTATGNGQTGFRVSDASDAADGLGSFGNVIHGNTASGDLGPDLLDAWGDCAHNTWTGNTFGTASPMCIR